MHRCARQEDEGQTFRSTLEDQTTESLAVRSPVRETTRMRGASMQVENETMECKECGRTSIGPVTGRGISARLREQSQKRTERCFGYSTR